MALFGFVWQFLQLAQFDQLGELVAVVFVDQLGELVRLLGLLVGVLVADNRAHVRPAFRPSPSGHPQKADLLRQQAIDRVLARSGAALVLCPIQSPWPCFPVVCAGTRCVWWSCCDLGKAGFIDAEVPFNL